MALFCRALASIFSKNDEAALDGVPPPECIPPNLCVVCVNRALLLEIDTFVPRVIRLLDVKRPPTWLCPIPQADEPELDTWEGLDSRAEQPDRAVLVTEDQLPPGLERTAVSMPIQGTQMYVVRLSEFSVRNCTTHKPSPACPTTRPYPRAFTDTSVRAVSVCQALAWATLKADLLFVIWELMGGKTRLQTQRLLVKSDFVAVLGRIFEDLTWATTAEDSGPEPGDPVSPSA